MGTTLSTLQLESTSGAVPTSFLKPLQLSTAAGGVEQTVKILQPRKNPPTAVDVLVTRFHASAPTSREKNQIKESIEECLTIATSVVTGSEKLGPLTYQQIIEYVNNTQEEQHPFGIKVEDIIFIEQSNEPNFEELLKQNGAQGTRRMLLWHGTHLTRVLPILENGFKKPKYNRENKMLQGLGFYFADRASKSAQYCVPNIRNETPRPGQKGCLLLCDVLLGDLMYSVQPDAARSMPPDNYHSVASPGKRIPTRSQNLVVEQSKLGSLVVPIGMSMDNPKIPANNLKFNEYTVYSKEQIKIVYLVFFEFTVNKFDNKLSK